MAFKGRQNRVLFCSFFLLLLLTFSWSVNSSISNMKNMVEEENIKSKFTLETVYQDFSIMEHKTALPQVQSNSVYLNSVQGLPDASDEIELIFTLKDNNSNQLEELLAEVSNPASPKYGQYLSKAEIDAMTANPEALEKTVAFLNTLQSGGVTYDQVSTTVIKAKGPVSTWEIALNTQFQRYAWEDTTIIRTDQYSLPTSIAPYVSTVLNTVQFPALLRSGPIVSSPILTLQEEGGSIKHQHHSHGKSVNKEEKEV